MLFSNNNESFINGSARKYCRNPGPTLIGVTEVRYYVIVIIKYCALFFFVNLGFVMSYRKVPIICCQIAFRRKM